MKFTIKRDDLLKPLQQVIGVVEKRQTLPILGNVLLDVQDRALTLTATDMEIEITSKFELSNAPQQSGIITLPGRKLMDICRALPDDAELEFKLTKEKVTLKSGRSRFQLATLPADEFPLSKDSGGAIEFTLSHDDLRFLTQRSAFAIAQQDVRYYLNGMLLEVNEGVIRAVATDGHRMALNTVAAPVINNTFVQVIIPRKGITELMRLFENEEQEIAVVVGTNHIQFSSPSIKFISKLVDGRFPDYDRVLPKGSDKELIVDRDVLKQALTRTSILSNEKVRGVRFQIEPGTLRLSANNPEQEQAEDEISVEYTSSALETAFNVGYLIDVLSHINPGNVKMTFKDAETSVLIEEADGKGDSIYVVMPMRL